MLPKVTPKFGLTTELHPGQFDVCEVAKAVQKDLNGGLGVGNFDTFKVEASRTEKIWMAQSFKPSVAGEGG